jgi:Ubiquitin-specific protease 7.
LEDRLKEEKNLESIKRKERNEAHLYMNVNVFLEDMFEGKKLISLKLSKVARG